MFNSLFKTRKTNRGLLTAAMACALLVLGVAAGRTSPASASDHYQSSYDRFSPDSRFDDHDLTSYDFSDHYRGRTNRPSYDRFDFNPSEGSSTRFQDRDRNLDVPRFENRPRFDRPQPVTSPDPEETFSESEKRQLRITQRYGNPLIERFVHTVSAEQSIRFYMETSQLIDARHLEPTSYQERTRQAIANLILAARNPAFLRANRLSPSRNQVAAFQDTLERLYTSRTIQSSRDAMNLLQATMTTAGRQFGLKPTTVAMEFVYGATESLDKYSSFVPAATARRPSAGLEEQVVGIGVEIKPNDRGALLVKPLRNSPAAKAGLQPGDIITAVNGKPLEGRSIDYAADLIGGPQGSSMVLQIVRDGRNIAPVRLVRQSVRIYSVSEARLMGDRSDVGYIKLDKFAQSSAQEMDQAMRSLHSKGMKSLVVDLRGNPGGLLTTAIELSNKFLPCGSIVSTRGRTAGDQSAETATYEQTWSIPLVVMVDENSASASEIFAAAIQENRRGVIVGRKSYGKGTVQTHFPLQSVAGNLRLTTAKFYSPTGRQMAGSGVTPDVRITSYGSDDYNRFDQEIETAVDVAQSPALAEMAKSGPACRKPRS